MNSPNVPAMLHCGAAGRRRAWRLSASSTPTAAPQTTPKTPTALEAELAAVASHIPGAPRPADLRTTPIPGIYEYKRGAELVYITADGRYGFAGDLYRLEDRANLSDVAAARTAPGADQCGARILDGGLCARRIPSTPSPCSPTSTASTAGRCTGRSPTTTAWASRCATCSTRAPVRTPTSWSKAEQVWCSADRRAALTAAKLGEALKAAVCKPNPVARRIRAGSGDRVDRHARHRHRERRTAAGLLAAR